MDILALFKCFPGMNIELLELRSLPTHSILIITLKLKQVNKSKSPYIIIKHAYQMCSQGT